MAENYCFKCGCYTRIDDDSKMCSACYEAWQAEQRPPAGQS